ncbi:hypothetical protein [Alicyclobacillus herbarius]|uniref:hypothetical protein n=1 Tax=Alicyclobacillus herbarius TaxID=122960 RepID=UPI0003FE61B8|nr:hypothetical protein [Alicyclobacillus herbarius]
MQERIRHQMRDAVILAGCDITILMAYGARPAYMLATACLETLNAVEANLVKEAVLTA